MKVREMEPKDLLSLEKLYMQVRKETFFWQDATTFSLEDFVRDTVDELIFVAEDKQEVIGFISLYEPDNFIHCLYVKKTAQGSGVGRLLLAKAREKLLRPIQLKCLVRNEKAREFYEKNGWQLVEEVAVANGDDYVLLTFQ